MEDVLVNFAALLVAATLGIAVATHALPRHRRVVPYFVMHVLQWVVIATSFRAFVYYDNTLAGVLIVLAVAAALISFASLTGASASATAVASMRRRV